MLFYSFDDYWKNFGKFHHEVIKNEPELEEDLYNLAKKIWLDANGTKDDTYDTGHSDGWDECEEHYKIEKDNQMKKLKSFLCWVGLHNWVCSVGHINLINKHGHEWACCKWCEKQEKREFQKNLQGIRIKVLPAALDRMKTGQYGYPPPIYADSHSQLEKGTKYN